MFDAGGQPKRETFFSYAGYQLVSSASGGRRGQDDFVQDAEQALRRFLRPFSFKAVCGRAAHVTARRAKSPSKFAEELAVGGFDSLLEFRPYLIRRVIEAAAESCAEDDTVGRDMSAPELRDACIIAEDFVALADRRVQTKDAMASMMLRNQQLQIHDLVDYSYVTPEAILALRVLERADRRGAALDGVYRRVHGLGFGEMVVGCWGLWGQTTADEKEGFYLPPHVNAGPGVRVAPEAVLKNVTADRTALLAERDRLLIKAYEPYSLSPLKNFPVIVHTDGHRSVPVSNDLLDRPVRPFFYDLYGHLDDRQRGIFGDEMGAVYYDYVYQSLRAALGTDAVFEAEGSLSPKRGENVCDLVCIEPGVATFIEVKSGRPLLTTDVTKEASAIKEEVARPGGIAHAVAQIADSAQLYRDGRTTLPKRQRVVGLVVITGEWVGHNSPLVRDAIRDAGAKQTAKDPFTKFQITDGLGFNALVRYVTPRRAIGNFLWKKQRDNRTRLHDMHLYVPDEKLAPHPLELEFSAARGELFSRYVSRPTGA